MKTKQLRKTEIALPGNKKASPSTEVRIIEVADLIVKKGYGRMDCMKWVQENWGLSEKQSERYYYAALKYLKPKDPDKYREALINRNFTVAETILQKALDSNNLKAANEALKILNQMLGVGGKQVEIKDKDADGSEKKIVISFGE